ncbi:unnamed protein product [Rotaria socialis]|uniref:DUF3597 domain-containing protein n=1 Tax=Rotaria socialis TaxID=392032 RepID=A0A820XWJ7_9BILA|nr:unnamed protein product [Rotaria socialis]CAF4537395.1 unnamed protein product [Rotaria socialis]
MHFKSDKVELWGQCDGVEFTVRRICVYQTTCYARDILYWQCRPDGNCPKDWICAQKSFSTNSSVSLETLKKILTTRASKMNQPLNWMQSIVDMAKLLGLDSREHRLAQLAIKLGFKGDMSDVYHMHIWLLKKLMEILAQNGGYLPSEFYES